MDTQLDARSPEATPSGAGEALVDGLRLHFSQGFVGCSAWTDFVVRVDPDRAPILELECVSEPGVSFLAVHPQFILSNYAFDLGEAERRDLKLTPGEEPDVLVLLVLRSDPSTVTANLAGPLVINLKFKLGRQMVRAIHCGTPLADRRTAG